MNEYTLSMDIHDSKSNINDVQKGEEKLNFKRCL